MMPVGEDDRGSWGTRTMSEEQGFEGIDKRRVRADAEDAAPAVEEDAPKAEPSEEATSGTEAPGAAEAAEQPADSSGAAGQGSETAPPGAGAGERLPAVTARDIVTLCIGQLH